MWAYLFWAAWLLLTWRVWRWQYRRPPHNPAAAQRRLISELAKHPTDNESADNP